jgi:hypothetical protein
MVHPCPKCGAPCESTGSLEIDGTPFPIFQCETCEVPWEVGDKSYPTAFTFCINAAGQWFDPLAYGDPGLN